jgi:hypothetical protein
VFKAGNTECVEYFIKVNSQLFFFIIEATERLQLIKYRRCTNNPLNQLLAVTATFTEEYGECERDHVINGVCTGIPLEPNRLLRASSSVPTALTQVAGILHPRFHRQPSANSWAKRD